MAYNTMSIVRQNPYFINNNMGFVKRKNQQDEEEQTSSSFASRNTDEQNQVNENGKKNLQQQLAESKAAHQRAVASRDANLKSSSINIAQIMKDFRSTTKAIGATPELEEEVDIYMALVEKQVIKESPDAKLVRSNLKNAASLLDAYITETLQRPSKVVENWLDALFLQQINYKFNEGDVNPQFLVKFPNQKKEDEDTFVDELDEESDESSVNKFKRNKTVTVPNDSKLKSLFVQAKKYSYAEDTSKAMTAFKAALDRAIEVSDKETESKVLYEIGKIYDRNDYLAQALTSYNKSLQATSDVNIKTKAHYSMAQIYDDVAQFESAINHYMSSISFAGENENLTAQSTSLVKIGNIYSDGYKKDALDYLLEADLIAKETNSSKTKGYVSSSIANTYDKFNKPQKALMYYSEAVKDYTDAQSPIKVAINYKRAAELMQDYNNSEKAKKLFAKALVSARKTEDVQLMTEINEALNAC